MPPHSLQPWTMSATAGLCLRTKQLSFPCFPCEPCEQYTPEVLRTHRVQHHQAPGLPDTDHALGFDPVDFITYARSGTTIFAALRSSGGRRHVAVAHGTRGNTASTGLRDRTRDRRSAAPDARGQRARRQKDIQRAPDSDCRTRTGGQTHSRAQIPVARCVHRCRCVHGSRWPF